MDGHVSYEPESADMAFHHFHDMQAFYRMHDVKSLPTRPHTLWPNRVEMSVLFALVDTASKYFFGQDYSVTDHTGEKHIGNAECKTPIKIAMGRRPADLLDPASMNPEQLTSTPTKQDLLSRLPWGLTLHCIPGYQMLVQYQFT